MALVHLWWDGMPLISRMKAMQICGQHVKALCTLPLDAWAQYHAELPDSLLVAFCPRTRASAVHNLMVQNAAKMAANTPGIRTFRRQLMDGLTIDGKIAIRFKKLDDESQSRNQPTKQVDDFRRQRLLDGIEAVHNLELGYVLNEHETAIAEVRLVCPSGRYDVAWWSSLGKYGDEDGGTVEMFPVAPDVGPRPPRIGPKGTGIVVPLRKKDNES